MQVLAAVGAKFVGFGDFALALRAGGVQVAFTVGAEVEARVYRCATLRTVVRQRLAHQQIDDKAENEIPGYQHKDQERPERGVHAAALGVLIDVAGHENDQGEN